MASAFYPGLITCGYLGSFPEVNIVHFYVTGLYVMLNIVKEHKENKALELTLGSLWMISAAR